MEPFYRVVFHELHEGASLEGAVDVEGPDIGAMDILGPELSAELGLPMGGVAGMVADAAVVAEAPMLAARAAAAGRVDLGERMGRLLDKSGSGRSLSEPEQRFLQRVHGQRFSEIRLHEGPVAQEAARTIAARAFTIGRDIYMGEPVKADSAAGAELLAHEATHVKQAAEGRLPGPTGDGLSVSSPEASYEREAEEIGQAGAALRQVLDRHEAGARPDQGDLGWFHNRFGALLAPDALSDIFEDKAPSAGGVDARSLAHQGLTDLLVDEACAAWLSTNTAMGAMAAGTDPARASALGLLQQALSATFASAIAGAQAGVSGSLGRLLGLVGPLSPDALKGLPVDPRVGRAELVSAARDILAGTSPISANLAVLGSSIDPTSLLQGGILETVENLIGAGAGALESGLVDLNWQNDTAGDDTASAPLSAASADWGLLERLAVVDPAGRAVLTSLQSMLPAGASAPDAMVQEGLRAALQSQIHSAAGNLQTAMLERLEQGPTGVDPTHVAGLVGLLSALDSAALAESTPLPSLVGMAGRPSAASLPEIGLQHAPYPDFADQASATLDHTPDFAMSVGFGDLSVDAPALLGASAEGALSDLGNVGAEGTLFRKAAGTEAPDLEDPAVDQALSRKGSGRPLPQHLRATLEARMGVDLADVRVHVDTVADAAARAVQAKAFTTGQDIFFRDGAFDASAAEGQELIAHEVVHTVQAGPSAATGAARVSEPGELAEVEADR